MNWIFILLQNKKKTEQKMKESTPNEHMIQQEFHDGKSNKMYTALCACAVCVWIGYEWMSGWAATARSIYICKYIVQVHALFANPKTHKIVRNGCAEVGECHIKTMKVNGHNSYAHHVLHIISAIYVRNVYASSAAFFPLFSLFSSNRFVLFDFVWALLIVLVAACGCGSSEGRNSMATNDSDKPSKYEKESIT